MSGMQYKAGLKRLDHVKAFERFDLTNLERVNCT